MSILRYEENGIEFFTLEATGESGMSQSGLARLCGVKPHAVNQLVNSVITSSSPEFLKPLQGDELTLITSVNEFNNATILKDTVCACILEWYAFESQRTTEAARQAFRKFATFGIRSWIQGITGWQNPLTTKLPPEPPPAADIPNSANLPDWLNQLDILEHDLLVALKHRHAIHNIVEQPTVVDLSLNRIVHTAVHVQAETLNRAIDNLQSLRLITATLHTATETVQEVQTLWQTLNRLTQQVNQLRQENRHLQQTAKDQAVRLTVLRKRCQFQSPTPTNLRQLPILETDLAQRIHQITDILMAQQKRTGGKRAIETCTLRATMLARYELGESLEQIAQDLDRPYETVKTYVKLARQAIRV